MIRILLARSPSRRESALAALGLDRPTVRLVANELVRSQVLDGLAGLTPYVDVLSAWLVEQWHRHGDGRVVLPPRATAWCVAQITGEAVETARLRVAAGGTPELWDAVRRSLRRAILAQDALEILARRWPRAATGETWVIDEPLDADERLATVVLALARAGADVVVCVSSGRDRAGAEAGELLGWDPPTDRALRVHAATSAIRRALFTLVESGEAEVLVAGADRLRAIEPWTEAEADTPRLLSDAYADQRPHEGPLPAGVAVLAAPDPITEVRAVAAQISRRIDEGADPRDCWIAADLSHYGALVAAVLDDHGLPHTVTVRAADTPHGRAVCGLLAQVAQGFDALGLCAVADALGIESARDVRRWALAAARPLRGPPSSWVGRDRPDVDELQALVDRLAPLAEPQPPAALAARLVELFEGLGLPSSGAVWGAVLLAVDELVRDALLAGTEVWTVRELAEELDAALATSRLPLDDAPIARIRVVEREALGGTWPRHLYVLGMSRGAFPAPLPPLVAQLDPQAGQRALRRARFLFAERLRQAEEPGYELVLSWPASSDDRAQAPSVLLAELIELPGAEGLVTLLAEVPADPHSRRAQRVDAVLRGEATGDDARQVAVHAARRGPLGPYDGYMARPPPPPSAISVSAMETYIACPARYWYTYGLRLQPPERSTPELEPRRRGTALHAILERFLTRRELRPLSADPNPTQTRAELLRVASDVLDELDAEGGFDPLFQRYARSRWVAGLADERPAGILRAWLEHEVSGPPMVPVGVEVPIDGLVWAGMKVRGVVDRIDRLPTGDHLVTDYKTGAPPSRKRVEQGLSLQPLVYSELVGRRHRGQVAAAFISLARADRVRRTGFVGDASALDAACTPAERRAALALGANERAERLATAAGRAESLVAGIFPPTAHPPDVAGCPSCPYRRVCRLDAVRHASVDLHPPGS